jgi:carboxypeptidase C (cathepsin A)
MDTLGIGNGIIDELIQAPYYPEFTQHNTYGIQLVNQTIYDFMKTAYWISGGCRDQVLECEASDVSTDEGKQTCAQATNFCRGFVEEPYYEYGSRGVYDIRHPYDDPTPPTYFIDYLNTAKVQNALGVDLNYTADSSRLVGRGFSSTGDFVYGFFIQDLETILNNGVRVALYYGDAGKHGQPLPL